MVVQTVPNARSYVERMVHLHPKVNYKVAAIPAEFWSDPGRTIAAMEMML
jgi:hypothetical protein